MIEMSDEGAMAVLEAVLELAIEFPGLARVCNSW